MLKSQLRRIMPRIGKKGTSIPRAPRRLEGVLDTIDDGIITGWAYDPNNPSERILLEITHASSTTEVIANAFRSDLEAAGKGDGHHAFSVALNADPFELGPISVRILATGQHLEGSPRQTGIPDLLAVSTDPAPLQALRLQVALAHAKYIRKVS